MNSINLSGAYILRWNNRNILEIEKTNIYKSTDPIKLDDMPPIYDTVRGDITRYADYDLIPYTYYYYRIGAVYNGNEIISPAEVKIYVGRTLESPFDLQTRYHEENNKNYLTSPFDLSNNYDIYIIK